MNRVCHIFACLALLALPVAPANAEPLASGTTEVKLIIAPYLSISDWTASPATFELQQEGSSENIQIGATISCNYTATIGMGITTSPKGFAIDTLVVPNASAGPGTALLRSDLVRFRVRNTSSGKVKYSVITPGSPTTSTAIAILVDIPGSDFGEITITFSSP